jgi:hypothetical protein
MDGACSTYGEMKNVNKILVGKLEGKRPPGRRRYRWEDHIKINIEEVGWEGVAWIHLVQDRDRWSLL